MIDVRMPDQRVLMLCPDIANVPEPPLPSGYRFRMFEPDDPMALAWARLMVESELMPNLDRATDVFSRDFGAHPDEARRRMLFIETERGVPVGTATAWFGILNGARLPRLHYVAILPDYQRRGLARPLLGRAMGIFRTLGESKNVFLSTSPRNYCAVRLYRSIGFQPYWNIPADIYNYTVRVEYNAALWALIDARIAAMESHAAASGKPLIASAELSCSPDTLSVCAFSDSRHWNAL